MQGLKKRNAQATLSLTILVGGTALLIGLTLALLTLSFLNSAAAYQAGNQALAVAAGGAEDAILHLIRNKGFSGPVTVVEDPGTSLGVSVVNTVSQATITSNAMVRRVKRKLEVIVSIDDRGGVSVVSWKQVVF